MSSLTTRLMSRGGLNTTNRLPAHSTPRIISTMGLDPSNPLLPPVNNLRMVYLKEPLTNAEKDLHAARKALRELEDAGTSATTAQKKALYDAMANLEGKETQYFATRYIGNDKKTVLQGWNTYVSDAQIGSKAEIEALVTQTGDRAGIANADVNITINSDAHEAASTAAYAAEVLQEMIYPEIGSGLRMRAVSLIKESVAEIEEDKKKVENLDDADSLKIASLQIIEDSLKDAKDCLDKATELVNSPWKFPFPEAP